MRTWIHPSARPLPLTPGAAVSVALHAALVGGAVIGGGPASRELEHVLAERVYFLPPPDRMPSVQPVAERVKYVLTGHGVPLHGKRAAEGRRVGEPLAPSAVVPAQRGPDAVTQDERPAVDLGSDSVYSILTVEQSATRVTGSAAPVYPPTLLASGVEGSVTVRFVVDTAGRADPATIEVLASSHSDFTQSVRDALAGMRFNPGSVRGHVVRQLVEQGFEFHIAAPVPATVAEHTRATPS